jgi:hypothetical protein
MTEPVPRVTVPPPAVGTALGQAVIAPGAGGRPESNFTCTSNHGRRSD